MCVFFFSLCVGWGGPAQTRLLSLTDFSVYEACEIKSQERRRRLCSSLPVPGIAWKDLQDKEPETIGIFGGSHDGAKMEAFHGRGWGRARAGTSQRARAGR